VGAYQGPLKEALLATAQWPGVTAKEALQGPARRAFQFVRNPRVAGLSNDQTRLRRVGFGFLPRPDPRVDGLAFIAQTRQTRLFGFRVNPDPSWLPERTLGPDARVFCASERRTRAPFLPGRRGCPTLSSGGETSWTRHLPWNILSDAHPHARTLGAAFEALAAVATRPSGGSTHAVGPLSGQSSNMPESASTFSYDNGRCRAAVPGKSSMDV
jgi:hypothetical protein